MTTIWMLILILLLALANIIGRILSKSMLRNEVEKLFQLTRDLPDQRYHSKQIDTLPPPVRRYFTYALTEGQRNIRTVRLKHQGRFKPNPKMPWLNITGEEYFTLDTPGFYWYGRVPLLGAVDKFISGKGNLTVKLLWLIPVINASGKATDQGELLRWLAESVWYPTALLPSKELNWTSIDDDHAQVTCSHAELRVTGVFRFNPEGQIIQFQAKRYLDQSRLEHWTVCCGDYRIVNHMKIPYYAEVTWNLESGDFCYAKFTLKEIEYDVPTVFK